MLRNMKTSQLILTVLFLLLFLAALVCAIVALTKNPGTASGGSGASEPAAKITSLEEIKTEVTFTDKKGELAIKEVAQKLILSFINSIPKKDVAFRINKVGEVSLAVIDSTMDYSNICKGPLSDDVWFISGKALVTYKGELLTDSDGYAFIGGRYIVRDGNTYTLYAQDVYENGGTPPDDAAKEQSGEQTPDAQAPADTGPAFTWGEYDTSTAISSAEMRLSSGVTLGMAFDDVKAKTGEFDKVEDGAGVKTATRGAYTYTFTLVNEASTSANDYGLPHDGKYYLTGVTADESCRDEFPRGIKIGDSIENVFTKFPAASTKLQEWAQQRIYGAYEFKKNTTYAYLEYRTFLKTYRIYAQDTGREAVSIEFDENNKVNGFEWIYQK